MGRPIEMIGKKFGSLTVIGLSDYRGKNGRDKYYICKCDCGNENIQILGTALRRKDKPTLNCKECGIKKKEKYGTKVRGTKLYRAWDHMKYRCCNENCKNYNEYGGRGIIICNEWLGEDGFTNFMKWSLENGFDQNKSIDRINNDGNYEPSNCRWTDMKTQANNKSINKIIEYNGISKTMSKWAEEYGVPYGTFVKRINYGWNIERALNEEVTQSRKKKIDINGEEHTYEDISKITGYSVKTLTNKYYKGIRDERLLERRKINE